MSFWYLATPYTKYALGHDAAANVAADAAALLVRAGVPVFSPIVHGHAIGKAGRLDPLDLAFWLAADAPFMMAARGIIVLRAAGWQNSEGMAHEIDFFAMSGCPRVDMNPGELPMEFRRSAVSVAA